MHGEIIPEDMCHGVYWLPVCLPSPFPSLPMQAIYVLLQKRFVFNSPGCKSPSPPPSSLPFILSQSLSVSPSFPHFSPLSPYLSEGKWKQYPVAVTAYSYFFGALFMGLSTIYFAASGQGDQFAIPQDVSIYVFAFLRGGYQVLSPPFLGKFRVCMYV